MPTLTPTPTIAPPSAPVKVPAQSPRSGRTDGATEQGASPFTKALKNASGGAERAESTPVETSAADAEQPEVDREATQADGADQPIPAQEQADTQADEVITHAVEQDVATEIPLNPDLEAQIVSEIESGDAIIAPVAPEQPTAPLTLEQAKPASIHSTSPDTTSPSPAVTTPDAEQPALTEQQQAAPTSNSPVPAVNPVIAQQEGEQVKPEPQAPQAVPVSTQQPAQPTPGANAQATPEHLDAQAIAVETPDDSASDGQQQGNQQPSGQQQAASLTNITPTESPQAEAPIEAPAAQPLRQPVAEAAPTRVDPAVIEAPAPQPSIGSVSARQGAAPSQAAAPNLGQVETEQAFSASVQRGLAAAVRQQGGTLTIKLDPPTLGKLTIKMTIDQGRVEATFDAQTAQARDLLMEHATTLRAALRDKGLGVERLEVLGATTAGAGKAMHSTANTGDQQGAGQEQDDQQHDAAGGQSRGRSETGEDEPSGTDGVQGDTAGTAGEPATSPFEAQLRYSVSAVA